MIKLGEFQKLKVIRLSDLGYMLSDDDEEVLLHFRQATKEYKPNDMVYNRLVRENKLEVD